MEKREFFKEINELVDKINKTAYPLSLWEVYVGEELNYYFENISYDSQKMFWEQLKERKEECLFVSTFFKEVDLFFLESYLNDTDINKEILFFNKMEEEEKEESGLLGFSFDEIHEKVANFVYQESPFLTISDVVVAKVLASEIVFYEEELESYIYDKLTSQNEMDFLAYAVREINSAPEGAYDLFGLYEDDIMRIFDLWEKNK